MTSTEDDGPRSAILHALRRQGPLTIDALAATLELSKTATRAHVLRLEAARLIDRRSPAPDGPGRPPVRVGLTLEGGASFPTRDAALLARLLAFLDAEGRRDLIEAFFREVWSERRAALLNRLGGATLADSPLPARLSALEALLAESAFMPQITSLTDIHGDTRVTVRECNCPLPAAVRATRIPCQFERRFLEEVVGGPSVATSIAADRTETCRFDVVVSRPPTDARAR